MFAVLVVLLNALSFASLAYVVNRKGQHTMAALLAAGAWLFGMIGVLIWVWRRCPAASRRLGPSRSPIQRCLRRNATGGGVSEHKEWSDARPCLCCVFRARSFL
jgi:hypothetical protein